MPLPKNEPITREHLKSIAELEAKIKRVEAELEKWQHHLVSDLDSGFWSAISICTEGIKAALKDKP